MKALRPYSVPNGELVLQRFSGFMEFYIKGEAFMPVARAGWDSRIRVFIVREIRAH